jgi:hypothetical protein
VTASQWRGGVTRDAATAVTPQCATYSLFRSFPCKRESSGTLRCRGETCPSPRPRGDERMVIAAATKFYGRFWISTLLEIVLGPPPPSSRTSTMRQPARSIKSNSASCGIMCCSGNPSFGGLSRYVVASNE